MAVSMDDALGIYVSIPFCRSKCTYCNFASGVYPVSEHARYVERLVADLKAAPAYAAKMGVGLSRRVDSIYLGGGTPTLLAPHLVDQLFHALRTEFDVDSDAEITVECAPGQLEDDTLDAFVRAGANRFSLGVQTFVDREAQISGRLHTRQSTLDTIDRLRRAGIRNLNIDLIAGLAGQTMESFEHSVRELIATGVDHASLYMLEVDEDSRLGREMLEGGARYFAETVPSDDTIASMYEQAVGWLSAAGLDRYEISNFSRDGAESRHNLRYWRRRPYLGVGLDAASMLHDLQPEPGEPPYVLRLHASADLAAYLDAAEPAETAWLSPDRQLEEAWFLGLRTSTGVSPAELAAEFGIRRVSPSTHVAHRLVADGLLEEFDERFRLTTRGLLLSNEVFAQFLDVEAEQER